MGRKLDRRALVEDALWFGGLTLLGGAVGWFLWRGKRLSAECSYTLVGLALGAVVGILYVLVSGRRIVWKTATLNIPMVGSVGVERAEKQVFALSAAQRAAGWKIYVELVGRIATQPVEKGSGTLRGALTSFHTLLQNVRKYLAEVPPQAPPASFGKDIRTLETLTIYVMTEVRQLLATWHHQLLEHEGPPTPGKLPPPDSAFAGKAACEADIAKLQARLTSYAGELARLLEVPGPASFKLPGAEPTAAPPPSAPPPSPPAAPPAPSA